VWFECPDGGVLAELPPEDPALCYTTAGDGCCGEPIRFACSDGCPSGYVEASACTAHGAGCGPQVCTTADDCVLAARSSACGDGRTDDVIALLASNAEAYATALCETDRECRDEGCPRPTPSADFVAACDRSLCVAFDLRGLGNIRCDTDEECVLRHQGCCPCDAPPEPIALHESALDAYVAAVCPEEPACTTCEAAPPTAAEPFCDEGRCAVR
jgi:hypothetical protein